MRVLFHCYEFPPIPGGVGSYIYQMGCALRESGHESVVVTSRLAGEPECAELPCGIVYRSYGRGEMYTPRVREFVLSTARRHSVDLIEGADHYGEVATLLNVPSRPPVLVKIHGSNPIRILQHSQVLRPWQHITVAAAHLRAWRQTRAERRTIEGGDAAIAPSQRMLEELRRQGLHLPPHTACIPNPMTTDTSLPEPREAQHPTLLLVGRLDVGKGIQYIPALLERIRCAYGLVTLELAGEDSFARGVGSIKAWLIRQLGPAAKQVRFLGRLDRAGLADAYARAWVVVLPSRWDNFPTVLLEAMRQGRPVVASPNGGMPEMLDGTSCRCVDPATPEFADEVIRLLRDSAMRVSVGNALGRRVRDAYSPRVVAARYVQFIEASGILGRRRESA